MKPIKKLVLNAMLPAMAAGQLIWGGASQQFSCQRRANVVY